MTSRRRVSAPLLLGLVVLLAVGCLVGWAAWQYWGTNIGAHRDAHQAITSIQQRWEAERRAGAGTTGSAGAASDAQPPDVPTSEGAAMALIRIPALGSDWQYPVLSGVTSDVLARGVGWYPTTAQPGAVGNFAVAAHRVTHGEPFRHLLGLRKGAQVIVETRDKVYTYELDNAPSTLTVQDTAGWVLDPVPGRPSATPSRSLITLTTCQDLFHSADRSVAFGHLVRTTSK